MTAPTSPSYAVEIQLRWGDMDAYGHINNVAYVRLLEQARVVGLAAWFGDTDIGMLDSGIVVARQEIEYLAQLSYRAEPISIEIWVQRLSGGSFDLGYEVRDPRTSGNQIYAWAESTMVCYDLRAGRPRRLTDSERAVFGAHAGPLVPFRRRREA